jgi:TRAP-type mannitol/chloroaromatic compound transport system permease small subunit
MRALLEFSAFVDRINSFIGKKVSWFILAAVLVSATNAIIRKAFDISSNAWLEAQWYLFGAVFMLAGAYTLLKNEHVRIDVLASTFTKRTRDWIDLVCHLTFLLPFCLIVWPAKGFVLFGFLMMTAQAISEIIKKIAVLQGIIQDETPSGSHGGTDSQEAVSKLAGEAK